MQRRMAEHQIFRSMADRRAIQQQPDVRRVRVLPSLLQAIVYFVDTKVVAIATVVDALVHLRRLVLVNIAHGRKGCEGDPRSSL